MRAIGFQREQVSSRPRRGRLSRSRRTLGAQADAREAWSYGPRVNGWNYNINCTGKLRYCLNVLLHRTSWGIARSVRNDAPIKTHLAELLHAGPTSESFIQMRLVYRQ